jgi:uncharacterized protein YoxC
MTDGQLVLLTALSGLGLLVLLVALAIALHSIQGSLDRINVHASKILWGVRAIERETDGLRDGLPQLRATLTDVVAGAGLIAERLSSADRHLATAADALSGPAKEPGAGSREPGGRVS